MVRHSVLVNETIMYSINPSNQEIIEHHLPFARTDSHLERYIAKGFSFERPRTELEIKKEEVTDKLTCSLCDKRCKSEFGLQVHMRSHRR